MRWLLGEAWARAWRGMAKPTLLPRKSPPGAGEKAGKERSHAAITRHPPGITPHSRSPSSTDNSTIYLARCSRGDAVKGGELRENTSLRNPNYRRQNASEPLCFVLLLITPALSSFSSSRGLLLSQSRHPFLTIHPYHLCFTARNLLKQPPKSSLLGHAG